MLNELSKQQLRGIISDYNLHYAIRGFSKMTKDELILKIKDYLEPIRGPDNITIYLKPIEREIFLRPRPPKKRVSRSRPQPEFIDVAPRTIDDLPYSSRKKFIKPLSKIMKKVNKIKILESIPPDEVNNMLMNIEKVIKSKAKPQIIPEEEMHLRAQAHIKSKAKGKPKRETKKQQQIRAMEEFGQYDEFVKKNKK